ncbi:MAG: transcriptional repressor LexA [bacterium]
MAKRLTDRQREILVFIVDYLGTNSFPPTFREIGEAIQINSTKAVNDHLAVLEKKGFILRERNKSRAIHILRQPEEDGLMMNDGITRAPAKVMRVTVDRPVQIITGAAIAAGPAGTSTFDDYTIDSLPIDVSIFGGGPCLALRVTGDSMEAAHICDGDLAIIRQQPEVRNGDIAAVDMDGEVTLKYFEKSGSKVMLISANPRTHPTREIDTAIMPIRVIGKYVGIIRNES